MAELSGSLEEALSLALSLSSVDRLKLVARVVSSVESEMSAGQESGEGTPRQETPDRWGAHVVALLDQLDLTDWEQMDIGDVGEWVRQLRRQESEGQWQGEPEESASQEAKGKIRGSAELSQSADALDWRSHRAFASTGLACRYILAASRASRARGIAGRLRTSTTQRVLGC